MNKSKYDFYEIVKIHSKKPHLKKVNGHLGVIRGKSQSEEDPTVFAYAVDVLSFAGQFLDGWFIFEEDLQSTGKKADREDFKSNESVKVQINTNVNSCRSILLPAESEEEVYIINPDILADIQLYNSENGGRKSPTPVDFFVCPVLIDGEKHDCRLLLNVLGSIKPGERKSDVPIKFLCSEIVMKKLSIGKKFYLWEKGIIGEGFVTSIFPEFQLK